MPAHNFASQSAELQQRLNEVVLQALHAADAPGAAVALVVDGQPILKAGIGFRDLQHKAVLDPDALVYTYSVTKPLLATAVLLLVDQGRLELDTPVQTYLHDLPLLAPVTVRQLLNHTGGLPDYGGMRAYFDALRADPRHPWTSDEFLQKTLSRGLKFTPTQGWSYSNIGYLILKRLIERETNTSMRVTLQELLFRPLSLQHTFVAQTLSDAQCLTPAYSTFFSPDGSLKDVTHLYHPGWVSHGVVVSTASELAGIFEALFTNQLLSPALLPSMLDFVHVPGQHPFFTQQTYGLGLMIDPQSRYGQIAGHGGGGPGYSTAALHFPNVAGHRVTSVALANREQHDLGMRIAFSLVDILADFMGYGEGSSPQL